MVSNKSSVLLSPVFHSKKFQIVFIIFCAFLVYLPSLYNDFIWDDDSYVYSNDTIKSPDGLHDIWFSHKTPQYYPITFTSFLIEYALWHDNPCGYHVVNVLLHIINACLLFFIIQCLYPRVAFFVALLFAVHPIQVETVAWITERKNLLSLLFFLSATTQYIKFNQTEKYRYYTCMCIFFVCALLSKSISACFVFVPVLYAWWRTGTVRRKNILLSLPLLFIGLISALHTSYLELYKVGAYKFDWELSIFERVILAGRIFWFYIYQICLPINFMTFYPNWDINVSVLWQWLFPCSVIVAAFLLFYYRKILGRGVVALFLFYGISIFPVLGFLKVFPMIRFSYVADHFTYLSTPALFLLICSSVLFLWDTIYDRLYIRYEREVRTFLVAMVIVITFHMALTSVALIQGYRNRFTFWETLIKKNPKAWMGYLSLGFDYYALDEKEHAVELFKQAIELNPACELAYLYLACHYYKTEHYDASFHYWNKAVASCGRRAPDLACFVQPEFLDFIRRYQKEKDLETRLPKKYNQEK
ncbi:MAG: tetratricopeptide repeat protein [Candidatus Omnitrophica bacterium]|nr:tetratricopeptide repeat protein [Candidatus Omnitrophota bacterium]